MHFDLSQVPFSKRGSYFAISELTDSTKKDAQKLYLERPVLRTRHLPGADKQPYDSRNQRHIAPRGREIPAIHSRGGGHHRQQEILQLHPRPAQLMHKTAARARKKIKECLPRL